MEREDVFLEEALYTEEADSKLVVICAVCGDDAEAASFLQK
ncbi:hypothetical protein [Halalkalibacter oceani]|nr:hypothetical protein [Halalkalibacter oceani]